MNIIKEGKKIVSIIPDMAGFKNCVFKDCEGLELLFGDSEVKT